MLLDILYIMVNYKERITKKKKTSVALLVQFYMTKHT